LDRSEQSADVVLLLGPLYHLIEAADRRKALQEAYRVLVPGGLLFAAAISRFASALDGLAQDLFADPVFDQIVQRDIADGIVPASSNFLPPRNSTGLTNSPRRCKPPDFPFCRSSVWRGRDGCFPIST
jgi:ubiquinone/menaquinone biosynthesis C-methylase UbiE